MNEKLMATVQQCVKKHFVTAEEIESIVAEKHFWQVPGTTMTVCCIKLVNGFTVLGQAACFDPAVFDAKLGEKHAYEDALENTGRFLAFTASSL